MIGFLKNISSRHDLAQPFLVPVPTRKNCWSRSRSKTNLVPIPVPVPAEPGPLCPSLISIPVSSFNWRNSDDDDVATVCSVSGGTNSRR